MIKVLITDDEMILCESLKVIIEQDPEIEVIGLAENGIEALRICDENLPDLVLMDLRMPVCDGVEGTNLIKKKYPNIKVLILTTFNDDQSVNQALKNGANGYVLKNIKPFELREAIKTTYRGLNVIKEDVFNTFLKQINSKPVNEPLIINGANIELNDKEITIIQKIVQGKSNKEIACSMKLSEGRIKNILSDIYIKSKTEDRVQLAVFAVKNHLC